MIKVCKSRNSSKLLLRKAYDMTPMAVFGALKKLVNFDKLVGNELHHGYFEYQIIFKCNEEAVHARREILKSILKFGPKAVVVWDNSDCEPNAASYRIQKHFSRSIESVFNPDKFKGCRTIFVQRNGGGGFAEENL